MKFTGERILAGVGLLAPAGLWLAGEKTWGWGLLLGEALGAVSFLWIGMMIQRQFSTQGQRPGHRRFLVHSLLRYIMIGSVLFLALKWPAVNIWGVAAGYSLIQLPAAILRAFHKKEV